MDEELKEQLRGIIQKHRVVGRAGLIDAILALVVAERDAMKEAAIKHRPTQCHEATGYLTRCECGWKSAAHRINWQEGEPDEIEQGIEEWKAHVRSLTPSTAQSREREIRADELLTLWQKDYVCNGGYGPGYLTQKGREWITERRAELYASSQPKGACTCDRTGWPGSASPELHEVNCPAIKDGRRS